MKDRLRKRRQSNVGVMPKFPPYRERRGRANHFAYALHRIARVATVATWAIEALARYRPRADYAAWAKDIMKITGRDTGDLLSQGSRDGMVLVNYTEQE